MRFVALRFALQPLLQEAIGASFPTRCPLCDEPDLGDGAGCAAHHLRTQVAGPRCGRCASALPPVIPEGTDCAACHARRPRFARAVCLLDYRDAPTREWILAFKHRSRRDLAEPLGRLLGARARIEESSAHPNVLVPVPLHPTRVLERGYDQALLVARTAGWLLEWPVARALARVRATPPQGSVLGGSRIGNVRGAFAPRRFAPCARRLVAGAECWLVDDVLTSGATADECARVLKRLGAARVNVLALARA